MMSCAGRNWDPGLDKALKASRGRYAKINAISTEHGIATTALMARWHILRARAKAKPRVVPSLPIESRAACLRRKLEIPGGPTGDASFDRMVAGLRGKGLIRTLRVLYYSEPMTWFALADATGMSRDTLRGYYVNHRHKLAKQGWQMVTVPAEKRGTVRVHLERAQ